MGGGGAMTELLPCPFCGGEAQVRGSFMDGFRVECCGLCFASTQRYRTEAEAIEAWNTRTPIEYEGWFYLPKPKEGIVQYGEPEMTRTENGYKFRQTADVVAEAARKWGDELGEYVMRRICETWNTRSAGTCEFKPFRGPISDTDEVGDRRGVCSECSAYMHEQFNYCPNCGRKVSA